MTQRAETTPAPSTATRRGPLTVGVVGGGQLARMMGPAAIELGIELHLLSEAPDSSAVPAAAQVSVGTGDDLDALRTFAADVDVVTFDHEHVPNEHTRMLIEEGVRVEPRPEALVHAQDKIVMRRAVERLGLPNPRWAEVADAEQLVAFAEDGADAPGWPVILKTPRGGYDGKGVLVVGSAEEARSGTAAAWFAGGDFPALLAEEAVPFSRELSALVARTPSGEIRCWPVAESIQTDSVCDLVTAPAPELSPELAEQAAGIARTIAAELGVTGVMAAELFEVPGRGILVNELAMRPHNSGHWTMDGAVTGQFEQHLRAVLDLPLGAAEAAAPVTVMKNILGGEVQDLVEHLPQAMAETPAAKVHLYGKGVRPGRKVGHVNLTSTALGADDHAPADRVRAVQQAAERAAVRIRDGR